MRHTVLLASALLVSLGCSDSTGPADVVGEGDFTITVGSGLNPTYSWSAGAARGVLVRRVEEQTSIWGFVTVGDDAADSPQQHGILPNGGIPLGSADLETTLTAGVRYRVIVNLKDSRSARTDFTR